MVPSVRRAGVAVARRSARPPQRRAQGLFGRRRVRQRGAEGSICSPRRAGSGVARSALRATERRSIWAARAGGWADGRRGPGARGGGMAPE
eukprot:gene11816-biopygen16891